MHTTWTVVLVAWGAFMAGVIVMALARAKAEHLTEPDPETTVRWPDLEREGSSSSATVPTAPAPLAGPER